MAETLSTIGTMIGNDIKDLRIKKLDKEEANQTFLSTVEQSTEQMVKSDINFQGTLSINKVLENTFDIRNKNITDIKDATDIILKLKPVKQLINNVETVGFISTEIKDDVPNVITQTATSTKMEYSKLIPFLVAALQEQQLEINALKNK